MSIFEQPPSEAQQDFAKTKKGKSLYERLSRCLSLLNTIEAFRDDLINDPVNSIPSPYGDTVEEHDEAIAKARQLSVDIKDEIAKALAKWNSLSIQERKMILQRRNRFADAIESLEI